MMQAGIFTGYFPYGLEETAKKIRGLGFNTVQLDLHFKDVDLSAGQITKDKAKKVRDVFRDNNLPVCCVSGYTNIIHPDKAEREFDGVVHLGEQTGIGVHPDQQALEQFLAKDLQV